MINLDFPLDHALRLEPSDLPRDVPDVEAFIGIDVTHRDLHLLDRLVQIFPEDGVMLGCRGSIAARSVGGDKSIVVVAGRFADGPEEPLDLVMLLIGDFG